MSAPNRMLDAALAAHAVGLCVVPPREDGSKQPLSIWKQYQAKRPDEEALRRWYGDGTHSGLGLVCGEVSGHLEMLEFEGRAVTEGVWNRFVEAVRLAGLGDLGKRITTGWRHQSPSGGLNLLYRCTEPVEGDVLARRPATAEELAADQREHDQREAAAGRPTRTLKPTDRPRILIETRAEGQYAIVPPSNGRVHPTGKPYLLEKGDFSTIATIEGEAREALLEVARMFDQMPPVVYRPEAEHAPADGRPGDDFNQRADWRSILEPHGWTYLRAASDHNQHWCRPGREGATSATIADDGGGPLYVFSTSTAFPAAGKAYTKFAAYAFLNHGGDFKAAAQALRGEGYGKGPDETTYGFPTSLESMGVDDEVTWYLGFTLPTGELELDVDALRNWWKIEGRFMNHFNQRPFYRPTRPEWQTRLDELMLTARRRDESLPEVSRPARIVEWVRHFCIARGQDNRETVGLGGVWLDEAKGFYVVDPNDLVNHLQHSVRPSPGEREIARLLRKQLSAEGYRPRLSSGRRPHLLKIPIQLVDVK